jgi:hypothetical protein
MSGAWFFAGCIIGVAALVVVWIVIVAAIYDVAEHHRHRTH